MTSLARTIASVVTSFTAHFVAVPALRRVEPVGVFMPGLLGRAYANSEHQNLALGIWQGSF
jgi:hypothetical protein